MIHLKKEVEFITDIEAKYDINSIIFKDFKAWPVVRKHLIQKLRALESVPGRAKKEQTSPKLQRISGFSSFLKEKKVLFLSRSSDRTPISCSQSWNKFSDSFRILGTPGLWVSEWSDSLETLSPAIQPDTKIDGLLWTARLLEHFQKSEQVLNLNLLRDPISSLCSFDTFEKGILTELKRIESYRQILRKYLKASRTQLVFIVCWYDIVSQAASLATRDLRIPSVEVQHGAQNDANVFIAHWTSIPKDGYELLPKVFWNWGKSSRDRISSWAQNTKYHYAIIGGNPWLTLWKEDFFPNKDTLHWTKSKRHVLVSLQVCSNSLISELKVLINKTQTSHIWHLREHPRHPIEKEKRAELESFENVDFKDANSVGLYTLLKASDLHMTGYSTVAFEAEAFGVPTLFWDKNALYGYSSVIESSPLLTFSTQTNEILDWLQTPLQKRTQKTVAYIQTGRRLHKEALEEILQREKKSI